MNTKLNRRESIKAVEVGTAAFAFSGCLFGEQKKIGRKFGLLKEPGIVIKKVTGVNN